MLVRDIVVMMMLVMMVVPMMVMMVTVPVMVAMFVVVIMSMMMAVVTRYAGHKRYFPGRQVGDPRSGVRRAAARRTHHESSISLIVSSSPAMHWICREPQIQTPNG
jgi:hypothetical protein